ncbi:MAG: GAF domain-containing protein [Chloroflexota bacterium]
MEPSLGIYFDALYQIVLRLSSSLDLEQVLAYVTEETSKAMTVKAASVRLLDQSGELLEMQAVFGLSPEYLNKGPVEVARSEVDRELLGGAVTQIADVTKDGGFQYPEEAAREGIVSIASVPLQVHGAAIGVLRVYSGERRTFTEAEMRFLVAVADVAALSIENARLYDELRQRFETTMNVLWGDHPV